MSSESRCTWLYGRNTSQGARLPPPLFETSIRQPALSESTQAKIERRRKRAAAGLEYYLQQAVPGVDWLPKVRCNYFKRWLDAEASYYDELIPTDEGIELWLHDLTDRTLNHQHRSSRGREFEPELSARKTTGVQSCRRAGSAKLQVWGEKKNGLIVDYVGVFRNLQKALAIYGTAQGEDQLETSLPLARLAAKASPRTPETLDTLTEILFERGSHTEAITWMERAAALDPKYEDKLRRFN